MKGTPFGRYELIELLGRGGMGEVWKAFDTVTQRVVAVKVLPAQLAADPVFGQRFRREAHAAAGLNDPHVVPIHNFGEIDHRLYVDMRLIDGQDLEHVLTRGPLDPERAVKIIEQVASALNAAHRVGLVHRDVKPSNILLAEDDFSYLIDFGIARGTDETGLTTAGSVVGTWPYMAPERFTAGQNDTRSDIYALACVLYECLTASQPFPGDVEQQIAGHLMTPPPRPSVTQPGVPPQLDSVIATGMAKDPDQRYGTTTELARAARSAISGEVPESAALQDPEGTVPTQAQAHQDVDAAWAPTQARPAEGLLEAPAPSGETPDERSGTEPAPWPWWQRKAIVIPAAAALMVVALVTIIFAVNGSAPPARPNGPLAGTFTVEFGAPTAPNGQPYENAPGGSEIWVVGSACRSGACVATASKVSGSQSSASTLVLDEINGKWMSVSAAPGTCQNAPTEFWETMSLQSQPDGSLHGEFAVRSTTDCARNQQVTFTRTGDVERNVPIADPQAQPPRVASPAEGLHGQYQETDTYADGGRSAQATFDIQTYCLRTGERCLSYWLNPDDAKILVFSQSQWVLATTSSDSKCQNGGAAHREITLQYPLPPPQNPITLLTGSGHYTLSGACPFNSDFDSRVERTGN